MSDTLAGTVVLLGVILATWVIPSLGMRMLAPSLAAPEHLRVNYRGRTVFLGLGIVWIFWTLGITTLSSVLRLLPFWPNSLVPAVLGSAAWLVSMCFVFGFVDDVFGTSAEKGLRGHLSALARGRMTTGGLKLIGIGLVSLIAAANARLAFNVSGRTMLGTALEVILATVLIAGSSNLLNLLDLRPGRALKCYLALALIAWGFWMGSGSWGILWWAQSNILPAALLAIALVGPAVAVWRYDLGEKGMLGDAGANPAGVVVGFVLAVSLPLWGLVVAAALVVAANIASEMVSFSAIIERNRVLSWLDSLGRMRDFENEAVVVMSSSDKGGPDGASDR